MFPCKFVLSVVVCFTVCFSLISAQSTPLTPLTISGNNIMKGSQRFVIKGAAYDYPVHDDDPNWLTAVNNLLTNLPNLNYIRLYDMDPSKTYNKFISWARDNNIYYSVPLTPNGYTVPYKFCPLARMGVPALGPNTCYPSCLLNFGQQLMATFSNVPEVAAFVVANEVFQNSSQIAAGPCLKGYIRDLKAWRTSCGSMRTVPLMYTAQEVGYPDPSDVAGNDRWWFDYLTCGGETQSIDIYGLNEFRWCGSTCATDATKCGLTTIHDNFATNLLIPVILSEYGCANYFTSSGLSQRDWTELEVIYSSSFYDVFSGGVAYAYGKGEVATSDFSMFTGGDEVSRIPGLQKTCDANNVCNVDFLQTQMASISSAADSASLVTIGTGSRSTCPTIPGVDLTLPTTRQGADGYELVSCPTGSSTSTGVIIGNGTTGATSNPPKPNPDQNAGFNAAVSSFGVIASLLAVIAVLAA